MNNLNRLLGLIGLSLRGGSRFRLSSGSRLGLSGGSILGLSIGLRIRGSLDWSCTLDL
jgi:hypothetical protein